MGTSTHRLKMVTIGGGSSYTPELIEGLIKRYDRFPLTELHLVDIDEGLEKLSIIEGLTNRMFTAAGLDVKVFATTDRRKAIKDADFITTQFRVGQMEARRLDEHIPNKYGMLGQETNGAGSLFKALRTIPIIMDIVKDVQELAPNAWIINFTNPSGIVSEAVHRYTDFHRFIGVCNVPIATKFWISKALDVPSSEIEIDFLGLNHLVYGLRTLHNGKDISSQALEAFLDSATAIPNIKGMKFDKEFITTLGLIPCFYHSYYFKNKEQMEHQMEDFAKGISRATQVMEYEKELFKKYQNPDLKEKPEELSKRGGAYYSDVACDVLTSIYGDEGLIHAVNIKNNGHVKNIDPDDTIEISARLTKDGAVPLDSITELPRSVRGLHEFLKSYELLAVEAVMEKSYEKAILALNMNPFSRSDTVNRAMFEELFEAHRKYVDYLK